MVLGMPWLRGSAQAVLDPPMHQVHRHRHQLVVHRLHHHQRFRPRTLSAHKYREHRHQCLFRVPVTHLDQLRP